MANELIHSSAGTAMTQTEFEAVGLHVCNNQAIGDLIYASSITQLSRLAIGVADTVLTCNGTIPSWSATPILNTAVAKGTWTASGTWTIPAVTLGGAVSGNSQTLSSIGNLSIVAGGILQFLGDEGIILCGTTFNTNDTRFRAWNLTDNAWADVIVIRSERLTLVGTTTGYLGFLGTTPVVRQTGVAVTAAAIHAALVAYGLITA